MSIKVSTYQSTSHLFTIAAHDFLAELERVAEVKPYFDVALSGGETAKEFFSFLVPIAMYHPLLKRIRFFFGDERALPLDSKNSNAGNAWRLLLEPLGIDKSQFFPMFDEKLDAQTCAENYQKLLLNSLAQKQGVFCFDLLYLGLGLDGHIASLFPQSPLLNKDALVTATTEPGIEYERITLMPKAIKAAKKICLLATGAKKIALIDEIRALKGLYPAELIFEPELSVQVLLAQ